MWGNPTLFHRAKYSISFDPSHSIIILTFSGPLKYVDSFYMSDKQIHWTGHGRTVE